MDKAALYEKLTLAANRAYSRGLQTGSGGNLSQRIDENTMIVKASGGSFADCDSQGKGWVTTDFDGNLLEGEQGKPTREVLLHGLIYKIASKFGGVMHSHSPWSITCADKLDKIPLATWHSQLKFDCDYIPVIDVPHAVVPVEWFEEIEKMFEEYPNLPGFILRGHGIVAVGKDIIEAEHTAELIDETAQIVLFTNLSK